jgi:N utilization substance protein B
LQAGSGKNKGAEAAMGRRQARETVIRTLYQVEVGGIDSEKAFQNTADINETLDEEAERLPLNTEDYQFARDLVFGTISNKQEIDEIIAALSRDWNIDRLARVDHNIMRLALYEILHREDIPASVTVNEAVDLAKLYGSEESGRFVNGILGRVLKKGLPQLHTLPEEFDGEHLMKEDL